MQIEDKKTLHKWCYGRTKTTNHDIVTSFILLGAKYSYGYYFGKKE